MHFDIGCHRPINQTKKKKKKKNTMHNLKETAKEKRLIKCNNRKLFLRDDSEVVSLSY